MANEEGAAEVVTGVLNEVTNGNGNGHNKRADWILGGALSFCLFGILALTIITVKYVPQDWTGVQDTRKFLEDIVLMVLSGHFVAKVVSK